MRRSKSYSRLNEAEAKKKKKMYQPLRGAASDVRHHLLDLVVREVFSSLVPRVGTSKTQARNRSMGGSCRRHHSPIWNHGLILWEGQKI